MAHFAAARSMAERTGQNQLPQTDRPAPHPPHVHIQTQVTAKVALGGPGMGGNPYSSYTQMPHLLGSTNRSMVISGNALSTFDLTMAPPPASLLPPPCPGGAGTGCPRRSWLDQPPVNSDNGWRCSESGLGILTSEFVAYRQMVDAAETLDVEKLKQAAALRAPPSAATVLRGGIALSGLVSPSLAAGASGTLNAAILLRRLRRTTALLRGTATADGGNSDNSSADDEGDDAAANANVTDACTQQQAPKLGGDATWMPLVPLSPADRACACATGAASPGKLPAVVQVLVYVQPGKDYSIGGFFLQA